MKKYCEKIGGYKGSWKYCPICGKETDGTYSEGGILFAICNECYKKEYETK